MSCFWGCEMRIDELVVVLEGFRARHGNMVVQVIGHETLVDDVGTFGLHTGGEGERLFLDLTAEDGELGE